MNNDEWTVYIKRIREEKNRFFAADWQSPIPPQERSKFTGLTYYPPDPSYMFALTLFEHKDKQVIQIEDTGGNLRNFLRWGEFRFNISGEDCVLQAYKSAPSEMRLFVPFRDATSGKETYGAGRYIDLDYEIDKTSDGKWILDFNKAYNPYCAYNHKYSCPIPPDDDYFDMEILAGCKKGFH